MTSHHPPAAPSAYRDAGVDAEEADAAVSRLAARITGNWRPPGRFGGVALPLGYFANVVDIGDGRGLAISTDGVGTKAVIAQIANRYDTIGIDCIAMNVNDVICVGAQPVSFVDYIAVERLDRAMLEAIAVGLAKGAEEAGVAIVGGETAQLEDVVRGFDLAGTAVGVVPLDRIVTGGDVAPGDAIVGIASNGIHSNGLSLARKAFFKREAPLPLDWRLPGSGTTLGDELLRPTAIYVREVMDVLERVTDVKAFVNITGDGLLNLTRVAAPRVGFRIDWLPETPEIFTLIQQHGAVGVGEMFEVFNMGVGFCVVIAAARADAVLSLLAAHGRQAWVIGAAIEDSTKGVYVPRHGLAGHGKRFHSA